MKPPLSVVSAWVAGLVGVAAVSVAILTLALRPEPAAQWLALGIAVTWGFIVLAGLGWLVLAERWRG